MKESLIPRQAIVNLMNPVLESCKDKTAPVFFSSSNPYLYLCDVQGTNEFYKSQNFIFNYNHLTFYEHFQNFKALLMVLYSKEHEVLRCLDIPYEKKDALDINSKKNALDMIVRRLSELQTSSISQTSCLGRKNKPFFFL